ncbi:MAG: hypothetical protein ACKOXF_07090 [Chitinophagaceae bacterium]
MADDINLNGPYNTKTPSYSEKADIQQALKLFLYGEGVLPTNTSEIQSTSLAGHLKALQDNINIVDAKGIGSDIASTQPTGVQDGFIWVDSTSSVTSDTQYAVSSYQTSAPTSPTTGALWVDSDSSPLKMYVWSGTEWKEIGA